MSKKPIKKNSKRAAVKDNLVRLKDYQPYPLEILSVDLSFTLHPTETMVVSTMDYRAKEKNMPKKIWLDGVGLKLSAIELDGKTLDEKNYQQTDRGLWLKNLPAQGKITTRVIIDPQNNRALSGLYIANGIFTTQCEAVGFRRITFYPCRPDVLSIFTVEILSDQPVLLSNGNLVETSRRGDKNHATWHDPFKKPSYLFALVAGDLALEEEKFTTKSGRTVALKAWAEQKYKGRLGFALTALQRAMRWDEERFGLEYDLDIFQIVAISDFNFGGMENKSLNIFDARYLLLDKDHNTDNDYLVVDSLVAHEYFHNWTGNRITVRDWFQLTLKEGLTVFRDQEYSMDNFDRSSERLKQVRNLKSDQFAEDASGLSHAARPSEYKEVNNFYTATVYEKGAEIIRMLHTILGEEKFQLGIKEYVKQQDGKAATVEDFIQSFEQANKIKLDWFMPWYSTRGTPMVTVVQRYDKKNKSLRLEISQTNEKAIKPYNKPLPIPLKISLFDKHGQAIKLSSKHKDWLADKNIFLLRGKKDILQFDNVADDAVASINQGFSAPINLSFDRSAQDLGVLFHYDSDGFNRWEAGQTLAMKSVLSAYKQQANDWFDAYSAGFAHLLVDQHTAALSLAENFSLPSFFELLLATYQDDKKNGADPIKVLAARARVKAELATQHADKIITRYQQTKNATATPDKNLSRDDIGARAINNNMLDMLVSSLAIDKKNIASVEKILSDHYFNNKNFTLKKGALNLVNRFSELSTSDKLRHAILSDYFNKAKNDELQVANYIRLLSSHNHPDTLRLIENIVDKKKIFSPDGLSSIDFRLDKPNQLYALLGGLASNIEQFFRADGKGYDIFLMVVKIVDKINTESSARLMNMFNNLPQLDKKNRLIMSKKLQSLQKMTLSPQLKEMVERILQS